MTEMTILSADDLLILQWKPSLASLNITSRPTSSLSSILRRIISINNSFASQEETPANQYKPPRRVVLSATPPLSTFFNHACSIARFLRVAIAFRIKCNLQIRITNKYRRSNHQAYPVWHVIREEKGRIDVVGCLSLACDGIRGRARATKKHHYATCKPLRPAV
jgi:hypothetical protein